MKEKVENIDSPNLRYSKLSLPDKTIEIDMGCGKGSFTTLLAQRYPEREIIAIDVMIGRLRKLKKKATNQGITNLEVLRSEAGFFVQTALPPNSISRLHILCPDPWPKTKHKGNRLISSEFVSRLSVILKPEGIFHFATDDLPYFESAKKVISLSGLFSEADNSLIDDISDLKSDFEKLWESQGKTVNHIAWKLR